MSINRVGFHSAGWWKQASISKGKTRNVPYDCVGDTRKKKVSTSSVPSEPPALTERTPCLEAPVWSARPPRLAPGPGPRAWLISPLAISSNSTNATIFFIKSKKTGVLIHLLLISNLNFNLRNALFDIVSLGHRRLRSTRNVRNRGTQHLVVHTDPL